MTVAPHNSTICCNHTCSSASVLQALQGLECPAVEKQESAWPACRDVLARGAVLYQQLDFVAAALMERARKHEHVPKLAALIAKHAEDKCNSTQLVRKEMVHWYHQLQHAYVGIAHFFLQHRQQQAAAAVPLCDGGTSGHSHSMGAGIARAQLQPCMSHNRTMHALAR